MDTLSPGTHSLAVDGIRQVYHVAGDGPVLVAHAGGPGIDHGYLRSGDLEKRFTVVYLEPVGTGGSGPYPEGATYVGTYVELLTAVIDHLGVPRVHLLGHSHGGFVVLRYALDHPDRVAGLALYSTSPTTADEFWTAMRANAMEFPDQHPDRPEAAEVLDWFSFETTTDEEHTTALRGLMPLYFADFWGERHAEYAGLQAAVRAWRVDNDGEPFDCRAELPDITARTVIICGRHDFICGPVWAAMLHNGIPGSELVMLENSGHFGQIEEPEAFTEAVTRLISVE
ncbi:alpha/beta fold hydrolase [Catenuloplanes sp. NPDC051500]|uniref:alpha/beta fold hydrolase n=1 Tax=Catenuloplanes sp. NPDC051500 TaxID=3363959 RepID=UPI0037B5B3DD